jgi:isocitrate/isopropylmalate dehydrogenase
MKKRGSYRVTLIPGDGIGPEVIGAATEVIAAAGAYGVAEPSTVTCGPKNATVFVEGEHLAE